MTAANQGKAAVYVDGKLMTTADNYSASTRSGIARAVRGLSDTVHTLRIVVLGKHRAVANGSFIVVDRFNVG